jgi:hypothetical protein
MLVSMVDIAVEFTNPDFFVLENPIGRIAKETGLPKPTLVFNPNTYGDPYTKRTQLWGRFDPDLPTAIVEPTEGSLMHKLWSTAEKTGGARSLTPEGFAYAFFVANNTSAISLESPATEREANAQQSKAEEAPEKEKAAKKASSAPVEQDQRGSISITQVLAATRTPPPGHANGEDGFISIDQIELKTETETGEKMTVPAQAWLSDIDKRLEQMNKLRGCMK